MPKSLPPSPELSSDDGFPDLSELVLRQISSLRADFDQAAIAEKAKDVVEDFSEKAKDVVEDLAEKAKDVVEDLAEKAKDVVQENADKAVDAAVKTVEKAMETIPEKLLCCFRKRPTPSQK